MNQIPTVIDKIAIAHELYHRLIFVVGPAGSGKTQVLRGVSERTSGSLVNVNLKLSQGLLDLSERRRALQAPRILSDIIVRAPNEPILLDNIEILFDVHLQLDPLKLLQKESRNKTIVAAWNGSVSGGELRYAEPWHSEYRHYPIGDFLFVSLRNES
jgi:ABC-type lipoprotein export system ATPase subunit